MNENNIELTIEAAEKTDYILLLSKLAEFAIESGFTEKVWDLYLLFGIIKNISKQTLEELRKVNDN